MTRTRLVTLGVLAALSVAGALVLATGAFGDRSERSGGGALGQMLPDLDPITPGGLVTRLVFEDGERHIRLGFYSSGENLGAGPLVIRGHRPSSGEASMTADQLIQRRNGQTVVRPGVGVLRYVEDLTHQHWHLLSFMTYELRRAADFKLVVPDQKSGFCLGDRYNVDPDTLMPGEPATRVYNSNCGPEQTGLLEVVEGMSVGWGDVYEAWRDGQYLELTGLPAGRYVLVHRVNPDRALKESNYGNNASSVLLRIAWPSGQRQPPRLTVLRRCPQTAFCG